jgi:hypothetical protein
MVDYLSKYLIPEALSVVDTVSSVLFYAKHQPQSRIFHERQRARMAAMDGRFSNAARILRYAAGRPGAGVHSMFDAAARDHALACDARLLAKLETGDPAAIGACLRSEEEAAVRHFGWESIWKPLPYRFESPTAGTAS